MPFCTATRAERSSHASSTSARASVSFWSAGAHATQGDPLTEAALQLNAQLQAACRVQLNAVERALNLNLKKSAILCGSDRELLDDAKPVR